MRTFVVATVATVVVALASGCSGAVDSTEPDGGQGTGMSDDSAPPDPETPAPTSPPSGDTAVSDSEACVEVRIGIEAFNDGDYEETVAHFELAVPLAEEQDDGSAMASQLIDAVRYYAELAPGLYPGASLNSPEFAKYKAITLGQCMPVDEEPSESPGVDV